jgi:hypothetical protein
MTCHECEPRPNVAHLCRAGRATGVLPATSTGWTELDAVLPGGGWPLGTVVELMPTATGIGELSLLIPTLAQLSCAERYVAFVSPPHVPFAPALDRKGVRLERLLVIETSNTVDTLWAFEQTLRCNAFGAVLAWCTTTKDREVRRLQLAAESGRSIGFLYRDPAAALTPSPAAIRLRLHANDRGLTVEILKCRGARSGMTVAISPDKHASVRASGSSLQPPASSL